MIDTSLGPYRIDAELGSGGMGTVYRATLTRRAAGLDEGTVVALKVVHAQLLQTPGFLERFRREADIGTRIRHENVVGTLDSQTRESDGRTQMFLVMEYVEGQTLRELGAEMGRVPEELCRHIGREVAKGLAAIHAAGAVHRDVKPENVLITPQHVVKVMDLGVARLVDEQLRLSQTGAFVGSIQYAAPEQFKNAAGVDSRADLHALGLILYELSTAQHPYQADDFRSVLRRVLDEKPRRPAEINPQLSPFFEELVLRLLAKDRAERFASATEVAQVLAEGEHAAWWQERAIAIRAETRRPLRRIRIPRETALYGREPELAQLRACYARACRGEGCAVLVLGEAGAGKTRLVDEFVGLLQQAGEDVNFLFGSYPPAGAATAAGAFNTAYREQLGDENLEEALRAMLPQTPILVPAFAALLRGDSTPAGAEPLTKGSLQTVFAHCTRSLAEIRPTIVLIDDLHFAPEEGRALFAALAMALAGSRVMLVGTSRPGLDENWLAQLDRTGAARVAVPRLSPKDLALLLVDAFGSERLAEELSFKIAAKSDGNPFFVFEILRGLREGQFITRKDDGTWSTTRVIGEIEIPSTVRELVKARVAGLDADGRNALDMASCCGFEFDPLLVAAALGMPRIALLRSLAQIERAHRLVRSAGERFVFDHHQVQEALYESLPPLLRREYHAEIANALEASSGAASKEPAALGGALCVDLAEHFLKGGQGERARRYLDPAHAHLEAGYLNEAAIALARRALAVTGLLSGNERVRALLRLAQELEMVGRHVEERATLRETLPLADAGQDPHLMVRARAALGSNLGRVSEEAEAEEHLLAAVDLARGAGDRRGEGAAWGHLGIVLLTGGRMDEALAAQERHLALARETGDARGEAIVIGNLGNLHEIQGRFDEARVLYERQLELATRIADRRVEMQAIGHLGSVAFTAGRAGEAQAHFERQLEIIRQIGDRRAESYASGNLGSLLAAGGHFGEAGRQIERSLTLAREIGHPGIEIRSMCNFGALLDHLGRLDAAREQLDGALARCRKIGDRRFTGILLLTSAELAWNDGRPADAAANLRESVSILDSVGDRAAGAEARAALGALLVRSGGTAGRQEARSLLEDARTVGAEAGVAVAEVVALVHLAELGDDPAAAEDALARHSASIDVTPRMEAHLTLFRVTGRREHLAEARRLLDDLLAKNAAHRESMLENVRVNREIVAAAKDAQP